MTTLTAVEFQEKVYDYTKPGNMFYAGLIPAIVLFYAGGPYCQPMIDAFERLEPLYTAKVHFYGIDVNLEPDLTREFGIGAIPTTILIPIGADPAVVTGFLARDVELEKILIQLLTLPATGIAGAATPKKSNLILPG